MKIFKRAALTAFLCAIAACGQEEFPVDESLLQSSSILLKAGGNVIYTFNPLTGQLGFNPSTNEFRAGKDDMSEYFILTLSELPGAALQQVTGDLVWTSPSGLQSKSGVPFRVEKIQNGTLWLWSSRENIGAVVRILEQ